MSHTKILSSASTYPPPDVEVRQPLRVLLLQAGDSRDGDGQVQFREEEGAGIEVLAQERKAVVEQQRKGFGKTGLHQSEKKKKKKERKKDKGAMKCTNLVGFFFLQQTCL